MMVISTTVGSAPDAVVDQLRGDEGILDIHRVTSVAASSGPGLRGTAGHVSRLPDHRLRPTGSARRGGPVEPARRARPTSSGDQGQAETESRGDGASAPR